MKKTHLPGQEKFKVIPPDMVPAHDDMLIGWKSIADYFSVKVDFIKKRRAELLEAGAIFYVRKGKPKKKIVHAFKSLLQRWSIIKTIKGEYL